MVKVTISDTPKPTAEEKEEILENVRAVEDDPEEFRRQVLGMKEVVIPQHVLDELGMTADELVAELLKAAKATQ